MTLLQTHRFVLRPVDPADAPVFATLCNDDLIARNTARIPHPYALTDAESFTAYAARAFEAGTEHVFAICDAGDIVGCCSVTRITNELYELGYWVAMAARGCGVATEAARAAAQFAFDALGADEVLAGHFTDNPASGRVLEKLGFTQTGTRKQFSLGRGGEAECVRMSLNRAAFVKTPERAFA